MILSYLYNIRFLVIIPYGYLATNHHIPLGAEGGQAQGKKQSYLVALSSP